MNLNPTVSQRDWCKIFEEVVRKHKSDREAKLKRTLRIGHRCVAWLVENVVDNINKVNIGQDVRKAFEILRGNTYKGVIHEFGSVLLHRFPETPRGRLMLEKWVQGVWLGKRFTTNEHVISLENGKVDRTRTVQPKSREDTWNLDEIDKIKGQPWDPSVKLTYQRLAQERFPKISDPTPGEEEYDCMPRSRMIRKGGLVEGRTMDARRQEVQGHVRGRSYSYLSVPQCRVQGTCC